MKNAHALKHLKNVKFISGVVGKKKTNICKECNHQKKEHNKEKKKWVKYDEYPKKYG